MKRVLVLMACLTVAIAAVWATGQAEEAVSGIDDADQRFALTWTYGYWGTEMDPEGLFATVISDKFNVDLTMDLVTQKTLNQKYAVLIASGDYPEILCSQFNNYNWHQWSRQGAFVALNDYLAPGNYPNLDREISMDLYARSTMVDGKIYGVPSNWKGFKRVVAYRKDWLENVGLEPPTTVDEFFEVSKAFTFDDPDGNGKNDTYGFALQRELESVNSMIAPAFQVQMGGKGGNIFLYPGDDGPELGFLRPGMQDYVAFLAKAWQEGIVEPSSLTVASEEDMFTAGRIGFFRMSATDWMNTIRDCRDVDPNADVGVCDYPLRADGYGDPIIVKDKGWFRAEVITRAADTPAKVKRILSIFDWLHGDGIDLLQKGIEGVHWTMEDGKLKQLPAWDKQGWGNYNSMFKRLGKEYNLYLDAFEKVDEHGQLGIEVLDRYEEFTRDPVILSEEPEAAENGNDMMRIRLEGLFEIITGERPASDLAEIQAEWRKRGGDLYLQQALENVVD
jgi:putative aldouronate transport system substrate-binding protein